MNAVMFLALAVLRLADVYLKEDTTVISETFNSWVHYSDLLGATLLFGIVLILVLSINWHILQFVKKIISKSSERFGESVVGVSVLICMIAVKAIMHH